MNALDAFAPGADTLLELAEACLAQLPEQMRRAAGDVRIIVMDHASDEILDELSIGDPLELTGLYCGTPLTLERITEPALERPVIYLYRLAILLEWAQRQDVTIGELVGHVLIHELGHHFGWSDEEMDATLQEAES